MYREEIYEVSHAVDGGVGTIACCLSGYIGTLRIVRLTYIPVVIEPEKPWQSLSYVLEIGIIGFVSECDQPITVCIYPKTCRDHEERPVWLSVLLRHALKNAAVPIVTVIGIGFALLISGVVITETVFNIPGLGRLTVDAILKRDYPIIQGLIILFAGAKVLVNLLIDISYTFFDPRIRQ